VVRQDLSVDRMAARFYGRAGAVNDALTWERAAERSKIIDGARCPEHHSA
jgi:hypothetical protein